MNPSFDITNHVQYDSHMRNFVPKARYAEILLAFKRYQTIFPPIKMSCPTCPKPEACPKCPKPEACPKCPKPEACPKCPKPEACPKCPKPEACPAQLPITEHPEYPALVEKFERQIAMAWKSARELPTVPEPYETHQHLHPA
jgi:hypothetical protein